MEYLEIVLKVLGIALVVSIMATTTANGIKSVMAIDNNWLIKLMVITIDCLFSYWMFFGVAKQTDWLTYAVVLVLTFAGAESIYKMIGELKELKEQEPTEIVNDETEQDELDDELEEE